MKNLFNPDSPIMQILNKFADLMLLNFFWMLCCLPVFTIGASTAAMYSVTLKMAAGEDSGITRDFFHGFKSNFKQGTLTFLALLLPCILLAADVLLLFAGAFGDNLWMALVSLPAVVVMVLITTYVYPLMARFHNSFGQTLKNALLLSVGHLPISLVMGLLNLAPVIWMLVSPDSFLKYFIWLLLVGFSGIAWINGKLLMKVFEKLQSETANEESV